MHQSMVDEVVEVMLAERRREATRQRRIAAARRAHRMQRPVPRWRVRVGHVLVVAGSMIGGPATGHAGLRTARRAS